MLNIFFHWMFSCNKKLEKEKDVDGFDLANFSAPASSNWKKHPAVTSTPLRFGDRSPWGALRIFLASRTKINKQIQLDAPPAQ